MHAFLALDAGADRLCQPCQLKEGLMKEHLFLDHEADYKTQMMLAIVYYKQE